MASSGKQRQTFWREHIEQWQSSRLSQAAYCQRYALVLHTFGYWKRKLLGVENPSASRSPWGFTRVQVESTRSPDSGLSLHFADGTRLDGIQADNVMTVCQLIEGLK